MEEFFPRIQVKIKHKKIKKKSSPKMEEFFPRIQVKTKTLLQTSSSAQMQTRVKLLGGMQSNY